MLIKTDNFPFERIPAPLLFWYRANCRSLAWRENISPYKTWVSEIMLQQTRVEAAKSYFERFMLALPTVYDLAVCEEDKLLKLWEGLGYYSRVRNMQKAARQIVQEYGGEFPAEPEKLKILAGVGDYTAGAIASIAFGKRAPAVDGNVFRVLSRLTENPTPIDEPLYKKYLEERLLAVYPEEGKDCSDFTQALMELGALICKPTAPDCSRCPLNEICKANEHGTQTDFPVKKAKPTKKEERLLVFLIRTPKGICVRKRETGVLKGTYEFPSVPVSGEETPENILKGWGVSAFTLKKEKNYKHIFTHIRWDMAAYLVEADDAPFEAYPLAEIEEKISLPTAFKQCLSILEN
ncbi:MAG: A/G-specific adenine glycosylase [Clostridia bacterium]|nr:A/G-specific adenine glycosylase [Clostridia bacterium]